MSSEITSAMILAAGLGTRMRPLTLTCPKPLIPVAGKTMADHALDRLRENAIKKVVMNVSYLADQITEHFKDPQHPEIVFSHEDSPLETGGGVQKALPLLEGEAFFIMNGDAILVDQNEASSIAAMKDEWAAHPGLDALLLVHPKSRAIGFDGSGDFFISDDQAPVFHAPRPEAPYVFTGVQILARKAFEKRRPEKWSLREIYQDAIDKGTARVMVHQGDWLHVGTPQGRTIAEDFFKAKTG